MIIDEDMENAIRRIALTADGELQYRYLQKRLLGVLVSTDSGALLSDNGERKFASRLMGLMAKGIDERGGRNSDSSGTGGATERPVTFAVAGPRPISNGRRGAGRRGGTEPVAKPDAD